MPRVQSLKPRALHKSPSRFDRRNKFHNHAANALGRFDELDARSVVDDFLIDVADAAVGDPAFQHDRLIAQCQPEVVERIEVQGKGRFDKAAAVADFLDRERLKNHDLAVQLTKDFDPLAIALFVGCPHYGG